LSIPLQTILATIAVYVVIAILLLSLNLTSRWRWWIKGGSIILTGAFFIASYFAISSILGWPSSANPPAKFNVVSTHIVEPNEFTGDPGAIYLWLEELDEDNVIVGEPRNYRLPYIDQLADTVDDAQDMLDEGEQVQGEFDEADQEEEQNQDQQQQQEGDPMSPGEGQSYYPVEFTLMFNDLPPVALPSKGAL
jgi:hypothetical protein